MVMLRIRLKDVLVTLRSIPRWQGCSGGCCVYLEFVWSLIIIIVLVALFFHIWNRWTKEEKTRFPLEKATTGKDVGGVN